MRLAGKTAIITGGASGEYFIPLFDGSLADLRRQIDPQIVKQYIHAAGSIAVDYAPYNIRANYLIPGVILTKMTQMVIDAQEEPEAYAESMRTNNLLHRFGQEQEIAMAAVYLAN